MDGLIERTEGWKDGLRYGDVALGVIHRTCQTQPLPAENNQQLSRRAVACLSALGISTGPCYKQLAPRTEVRANHGHAPGFCTIPFTACIRGRPPLCARGRPRVPLPVSVIAPVPAPVSSQRVHALERGYQEVRQIATGDDGKAFRHCSKPFWLGEDGKGGGGREDGQGKGDTTKLPRPGNTAVRDLMADPRFT